MATASYESTTERQPLTATLHEWLVTVDHKKIGIMYVVMAIVFLLFAGLEAVLIRVQLFFPQFDFLPPVTFNQFFTLHGTTMVFFVGMPILIGIGNYLVPLQVGARDMAFPRLNAFGFWVTLFGGGLVYASLIVPGGPPAMGWFAYAPLTEKTFARGPGVDFWALGLLVSGVGSIAAGVNFIATIVGKRAPGMKLRQVPFFTWTMLGTSIQILLAIPPLTAALIMLELDRHAYLSAFGTDVYAQFAGVWDALAERGFVAITPRKITLTGDGPFYTPMAQALLAEERYRELRARVLDQARHGELPVLSY